MAASLSTAELIGQLLAQADATSSPEERDLFYGRAQSLASRHSIELAQARSAVAKNQRREQPVQKQLTLGHRGQRALSWYVQLASAIARANNVRINIAHNSTYVNMFGMPSDIEMMEAIYSCAILQMVSEGDAFLRKGDYKKEVQSLPVKVRTENPDYSMGWSGEPKYFYHWTRVDKPVSGMTARQNFYKGFCSAVSNRLYAAKVEAETAAKAADAAANGLLESEAETTSTALVLREKGKEIAEFYEATSTARGSYKGASTARHSSTASSAGHASGSRADLGSRPGGALNGVRGSITA